MKAKRALLYSLLIIHYQLLIVPVFAQNNSLVLNGAYIIMNGGTQSTPVYLVVNEADTSGIIRTNSGGHIHSENQYNCVLWNAAGGTGNYVFPFGVGGNAADYSPFIFNKTTTANSNIGLSTWGTNQQNMPHPGLSNVPAVSNMIGIPDSVRNAIDRFWDIQSPSVAADLTFSYRGIENTTAVPTDTFQSQHWNGTSWDAHAGPGNPGVSSGIGIVGPISGQSTFSPWVLTRVPLSSTVIASTNPVCNNQCSGTATVTASGGTPPYSYSWNPSSSTTPSVTGLCAGIYTVLVTDAGGSTAIDTISIIQPAPVSVVVNSTPTVCGDSTGTVTATPSGGTPPYSYSWNNGSSAMSATGLKAGSYTVTVKDSNNCSQIKSVIVSQTGGLTAMVSKDTTITAGTMAYLSANGGTNYLWSPSAGLTCDTCANISASPASTTQYCVTISDANGCSGVACVNVTVVPIEIQCGEVFVPTAFSPDKSGHNDLECVYGNCIKTMHFAIYDLWGEKVFETTDSKVCWNGIYKGKLMNSATFVYYLDATLLSGETIFQKGNINLMR
jgi:gliding motility-associated-like protein